LNPYKLYGNIYNIEDAVKTILTLKYGKKYPASAVNQIFEDTGGKYNYVCITDDPTDLYPEIKTIPLPDGIEGHWIKIWMYGLQGLGE